MTLSGRLVGGDIPRVDGHISLSELPKPRRASFAMRDLLPGGYVFTHAVFWTVIGLVAVGTNAVAIILSIGLGLLVLETLTNQR